MNATWADFDISFKRHPITGDLVIKKNDAAIRQQIEILINTIFGEIPFHPEIGCGLAENLFENFTDHLKTTAERVIEMVFYQYIKRVTLQKVIVRQKEKNSFEAKIIYKIEGSDIESTYITTLKRAR